MAADVKGIRWMFSSVLPLLDKYWIRQDGNVTRAEEGSVRKPADRYTPLRICDSFDNFFSFSFY